MSEFIYVSHSIRFFFGNWVCRIFFAQKSHLIADTEGHLGNLDIDEGVVHSRSLLHLIDVINRMLEGGHCQLFHLFILFFWISE